MSADLEVMADAWATKAAAAQLARGGVGVGARTRCRFERDGNVVRYTARFDPQPSAISFDGVNVYDAAGRLLRTMQEQPSSLAPNTGVVIHGELRVGNA